ncbi:hypothetical protein COB87_002225 [Candidatus Wolfebacteria bacterium]|nr:hypothetical protein [Candidatus Wolfebacteria bacterium]
MIEDDLKFIESLQVKEGVTCDVYSYKSDDTKDLGIVTVLKGNKTPLQKVLKGIQTLEVFKTGKGTLRIVKKSGLKENYVYPGATEEVEVSIGDAMQWEADEDLVFHEICYPPYKDGRYENLPE